MQAMRIHRLPTLMQPLAQHKYQSGLEGRTLTGSTSARCTRDTMRYITSCVICSEGFFGQACNMIPRRPAAAVAVATRSDDVMAANNSNTDVMHQATPYAASTSPNLTPQQTDTTLARSVVKMQVIAPQNS